MRRLLQNPLIRDDRTAMLADALGVMALFLLLVAALHLPHLS